MGLHVIASIALAVDCDFASNNFPFLIQQTQFSCLGAAVNGTGYPNFFVTNA